MMQDLTKILNQFSTTELVLFGVLAVLVLTVIYLVVRMKKLSFNYYAKSVSKTVEAQSTQIAKLENQIKQYQRKETGVVPNWANARDDRSAYLLNIYNDTSEKIFNVEIRIDPAYQMNSKLFWKANSVESQKSINAFFVPGGWNDSNSANPIDRAGFLQIWIKNGLKPIKFSILYTETPSRVDFKTVDIDFKKEQLTGHMKRRLRDLKATSHLTVLSQNSPDNS